MSACKVRRVRVRGWRLTIDVWLRGPEDRFLFAGYGKRGLYLEEGSKTLEDGSWHMGPRDELGVTVIILGVFGGEIVASTLTPEGYRRKWESAGLPVGPCCGFF